MLTSISKTFNTAAIQGGIAIIKNDELRHQFYGFWITATGRDTFITAGGHLQRLYPLWRLAPKIISLRPTMWRLLKVKLKSTVP